MFNKKRIALVTGGSSGIGAGIAKHLAKQDIAIILTYNNNKNGAIQIQQEIQNDGGTAIIKQLDVTNDSAVYSLAEQIISEYGLIDILINNAGLDKPTPIESCSFNDWQSITRVKVDGNFLMTKHFLPLLRKSAFPNLIVISSALAVKPDPEDPAYSIGAVAATTFGQIMAVSLAKYNIRTNVLAPGSIPTNLEYWRAKKDPHIWESIRAKNPLGISCDMSDITYTLDFILNEKSRFINGNVFYIDGGSYLKFYEV
jgi:NAD(P)-dependent dehydrogenase (short-subunit alcohol dehydrogenase family)